MFGFSSSLTGRCLKSTGEEDGIPVGLCVGLVDAISKESGSRRLRQNTPEDTEAPRCVSVGIDMGRDRLCGFDLSQARGEVSVFLHYSFERLPGPSLDCIGVSIVGSTRDFRGHSRISLTNCFPVTEIPSLQLFEDNPIGDLPPTAPGLRASEKSRRTRCRFQFSLQGVTILIVTVHQDDDPPARRNPVLVSPQAPPGAS